MNTYKLPLFFLLMLILQSIQSQSVEWLNISKEYSFGNSIEQTQSGNYIVSGYYHRKGMVSLFDHEGQLIWLDTLCQCQSTSSDPIYATELDDRRLFVINNDRNVYIIDSLGQNIDSHFILEFQGIISSTITKAIRYDSILYLISSGRINQTYGSIIHTLDLNTLSILSQEFDSVNTKLKLLHYNKDGSKLKYYGNNPNPLIIKTDKDGNEIWRRSWFLKAGYLMDWVITADQSIYLAGTIKDSTEQRTNDGLIIKLRQTGEFVWIKFYKAKENNWSKDKFKAFYRIKSIDENEIILSGEDGWFPTGPITDMSITCIDSSGNAKWEKMQDIKGEGDDAVDFVLDQNNDIIAVGTAARSDYGEPERAFIIKIKRPIVNTKQPELINYEIFPNPTARFISIQADFNSEEPELFIFNLMGQPVFKSRFQKEIDISSLASGQYFFTLKSRGLSYSKKLTIIKIE